MFGDCQKANAIKFFVLFLCKKIIFRAVFKLLFNLCGMWWGHLELF